MKSLPVLPLLLNKINFHFAIFISALLSVVSPGTHAQPGNFDGTVLTLPIVAVFNPAGAYDEYFEIVLSAAISPVPGGLSLVSATPLQQAPGTGAVVASFKDGILTVPSVDVDGIFYWGTFLLVREDPVTFLVTEAMLNDEDDDDDGIPDAIDGLPLLASGTPDPLGIDGSTWDLTITVTAAGGACSGEEGAVRDEEIFIAYNASTDGYEIQGKNFFDNLPPPTDYTHEYGQVKIIGSYLTYAGDFDEDDGVTSSNIFINLRDDDLIGHEWWTWGQGNNVVCTNGRASVTGTRQGP